MVSLKARELKGNLLKVRGPSCATQQPSVIFLKFTQLKEMGKLPQVSDGGSPTSLIHSIVPSSDNLFGLLSVGILGAWWKGPYSSKLSHCKEHLKTM